MSQLLWNCLAPDRPSFHIEASTLLSWLHSLIAPSSACEMVILEDLASKVLSCTYLVTQYCSEPHSQAFSPQCLSLAVLTLGTASDRRWGEKACERGYRVDTIFVVSQGLAAFHKFAVLWQYMPSTVHQTSTRPFSRYIHTHTHTNMHAKSASCYESHYL